VETCGGARSNQKGHEGMGKSGGDPVGGGGKKAASISDSEKERGEKDKVKERLGNTNNSASEKDGSARGAYTQ